MRRTTWIVVLFALLGLNACAGFVELKGKDYPESAKLNFDAGMLYLQQENYETAQKYFQLVKNKYSFSMYAKAAELLIGDAYLKQDMYSEAIATYKVFQRSHPKHECVPYAQYRVGQSYYEQIAENWWFMPPAYEKDQDVTEKALFEFKKYLRLEQADNYYFDPDFTPIVIRNCWGNHYQQKRSMVYQAKKYLDHCMDRLIKREIYVANFYLKGDQAAGAALRLEAMFRKYPEQAKDKGKVLLLARAYEEANMYKKARATWNWIQVAFPDAEELENFEGTIRRLVEEWARFYEKAERFEQARVAWKYLADTWPDSDEAKAWAEHDVRVLQAWAKSLVSERKYDKAREAWTVIKTVHKDLDVAAEADERIIALFVEEAAFWREQNFFDRAVTAWQTLAKAYPDSEQATQAETAIEAIKAGEKAYLAIAEGERPQSRWQLIVAEGRQELEPDPDPNLSAAIPLPKVEELWPLR